MSFQRFSVECTDHSRTVNAILARSGQVCVAASRVYVQRSIANEFIEKYKELMRAAVEKIGDPLEKATVMGPLVNKTALERVSKMIERGKNEAELVVGGVRHGDQGCFVEPTVFLNPQKGAQIYSDEIFGPVAVVKTFDTEEEVLQMANDTEYGLMSGVFTKDINRAMRVSSKLDSGVVGVNCVSYVSSNLPILTSCTDTILLEDECPGSVRWKEAIWGWSGIWRICEPCPFNF